MRTALPLDHVLLVANEYEQALAFYDAALSPLGIRRILQKDRSCGFGVGHPFFWIRMTNTEHAPSQNIHIAFSATSKEAVEAFYAAAMEAGGTSHGAPEYQPAYGVGYYAAFVFDLDGNNVEAVFRESPLPEQS